MDIKEQFSDTEFDLHLGFHKTATTYIQGVFGKNRSLLAEENMFVPPLFKFRRQYLQGGNIEEIVVSMLPKSRKNQKINRLLIIDENLPGKLGPLFEKGDFYNKIKPRLEAFKLRTNMTPRRIFLSVRSYTSYFPSVFSQSQKLKSVKPFSPKLVEELLKIERTWFDCIEDIAKVFPDAKLVIWPYEVFNLSEEKKQMIISTIFDRPDQKLNFDNSDIANASLSWEATQLLQYAVKLGYEDPALRAFLRKHPFPDSTPISEVFWQGFENERDALEEKYERDLERIDSKFGLSFCDDLAP